MSKISFWAKKKIRKPVIVRFRRNDGSIVSFKAIKIIEEPVKVSFYTRKRKRRY